MDNLTITALGRAMFGPRWVSEVAREIGVSVRHMQRIAAGSQEVAPGIADDVIVLARSRRDKLDKLIHEIG